MRKFVKGTLSTVVEDNDRRIPDYLKSGWKEASPDEPKTNKRAEILNKAVKETAAVDDGLVKTERKTAIDDKKVNDAIKANMSAETETAAVDDGLVKTGGE